MSYGFLMTNSIDQAFISSDTYNLVYRGKATYVSTYDPFTSFWLNTTMPTLGLTNPCLRTYSFIFDVVADAIVPFVKTSGYSSIALFKPHSSIANRWNIDIFSESQPVVYVFTKLPTSTVATNHGIAVYSSNGASYMSTQPHIIFKNVETLNVNSSNITQASGWGGNLVAYYPNDNGVFNSVPNINSIADPIIHVGAPNSAAYWDSPRFQQFWYAVGAKIVSGGVTTRWGFSAFGGSNVSYGQSATQITLLAADATYFT